MKVIIKLLKIFIKLLKPLFKLGILDSSIFEELFSNLEASAE